MLQIKKVFAKKIVSWKDKKTGWDQHAVAVLIKDTDGKYTEQLVFPSELKTLIEVREKVKAEVKK